MGPVMIGSENTAVYYLTLFSGAFQPQGVYPYSAPSSTFLRTRVMSPSTEDAEAVNLLVEYESTDNRGSHNKDSTDTRDVGGRARHARGSTYVYAMILIIVVADFALYGFTAYGIRARRSGGEARRLDIRNSYVGLSELYASGLVNSTYKPPIFNMPRIVGQVYRDEPLRPSPQDEHLWLTPFGAMAPPDRHLEVSDSVHTVYQFRTIDFGMEKCQLALKLPKLGDTSTGPFVFEGEGNTVELDVCEVDTEDALDLWHLNWKSRPGCHKHVGILVGVPGEEATLPDFACKWGELHTYEVSCASPGCSLNVWSNQNYTWGIFLYQRQTV